MVTAADENVRIRTMSLQAYWTAVYKKPLVSLVFMIELSVVISIANCRRLLLEA